MKIFYLLLANLLVLTSCLHAGIQDDINALGPDGGTVTIPAGTNIITTTITVPSNVMLVGECVNSVLQAGNSLNGPVIKNADQINGNSGIRIKGFSIDGNKGNQSDGDGISLIKASDILISDVKINDCYISGIYIGSDTRDIRIDSCIIHSNGQIDGDGIEIEGPNVTNLAVMNCTIYSNRDNGINGNGTNFRLIGNYIYGHEAGDDGLKFVNSSGMVLIGNRIEGAANGAVEFNTASDFIITGNYLTNAGNGLDIRNSEDFILNGNISKSNTSGIFLSSGISDQRSGALVSNNMSVENESQGIFSHGMADSVFSGNLAANNGTTGGERYGIYIRGTSGSEISNVLINGNETVETREGPNDFQSYGLKVEHMTQSLISDGIYKGASIVDLSRGAGTTAMTVTDNLYDSEYIDGSEPGSCIDVINAGFSLDADINGDCYINFVDLAQLGFDWLNCNNPADSNCVPNWL